MNPEVAHSGTSARESYALRAAVCFCLAALVVHGCRASAPPAKPEASGPRANDGASVPVHSTSSVSLPSVALAGADAIKQLRDAAKGKTLVVNVWATFCIPCIEEMPELAKFYRERDAGRVEFLSLNADPPYAIDDTVKLFAAEKGLPFPVHVIDGVMPEELLAIFGASSSGWGGELPATFVFDAAGALKRHWFERAHIEDLAAYLPRD